MPYLRMFLGEQQIDEVFIPEIFVHGVSGNHFIQEEKQKMLDKHAVILRSANIAPAFTLDIVPSSVNNFTPLNIRNVEEDN